jgi:hypothetical protein
MSSFQSLYAESDITWLRHYTVGSITSARLVRTTLCPPRTDSNVTSNGSAVYFGFAIAKFVKDLRGPGAVDMRRLKKIRPVLHQFIRGNSVYFLW